MLPLLFFTLGLVDAQFRNSTLLSSFTNGSSISSVANGSANYKPLFEKHSNSTPGFKNFTGATANPLVKALLHKSGSSLSILSSNDLPIGTW